MTTVENASVTQFLAYKLMQRSKARSLTKSQAKEATRAQTMVTSIFNVLLHLAGFGCLTWAGFSWNITAGLVVAGISCFALAWLVTSPPRTQPPTTMS